MMSPYSTSVFLTAQVYGKINWVDNETKTVGLYLLMHDGVQYRCVIAGKAVEAMIGKNEMSTGKTITAAGELSCRCETRHDGTGNIVEAVVFADRITVEPTPSEGKFKGSVLILLRGLMSSWDPINTKISTFANYEGSRPNVMCAINMSNWIRNMPEESRNRFMACMRKGRIFTGAFRVSTISSFASKVSSQRIPVINMSPIEFLLQG